MTHNPADCPLIDQRGTSRPLDRNGDGVARCDIGAYKAATAHFIFPPLLEK